MPKIEIYLDTVDYDDAASTELIAELVKRRQAAFEKPDLAEAIFLSHVVSWMDFHRTMFQHLDSNGDRPSPSPIPRTVGELAEQQQ